MNPVNSTLAPTGDYELGFRMLGQNLGHRLHQYAQPLLLDYATHVHHDLFLGQGVHAAEARQILAIPARKAISRDPVGDHVYLAGGGLKVG
jgi:hypothetical protein